MFDVVLPFTRQQGFSWELVVRDDGAGQGKNDLSAQDFGSAKRFPACDSPRQMQDLGEREPVDRNFMSVKETAKYLNMSVPWVYREAAHVGLLPYRFGSGRNSKLQFKVAEFQAWVKQQRLPGD
ncbi:helix-turn-helix domain-containing protein [Streptomyces sp. NPDC088915]|uniref:helix-turn-helix domain-containing protein n=1 Tax=Streptomyces sp. NPDC088915 TaxID=3365912 RepID=UPI003819E6DD